VISAVRYLKGNFFPLLVCVLWWFPLTYFGYWTRPVGTELFPLLRFPVIGLCLVALAFRGFNELNWRVLVFLAVALVASVDSVDMVYACAKFAGLAAVIGVFSPLIRSEAGRSMREGLWRNLCWSAVVVVVMSVVWKAGGLPAPVLYFREGFPGITTHAMLFAPVTGIAAVFLLAKALDEKKNAYMLLAALCYLTGFTTLSRSAIAAATCGLLAVIALNAQTKRLFGFMKLLMPVVILLAMTVSYIPEESLPAGFGKVTALTAKGTALKSRKELWEGRLTEFKDNPVVGLGVGMAQKYGINADPTAGRFSGMVEPGSAYLVVLSMTGLLGAMALAMVIGVELLRLAKVWDAVPQRRKFELTGIGLLLIVHAGAEGWIYSPGGVICLYFWLWLGMVGDSVDRAVYRLNEV
jgi:hypothetical protein